VRAQVPEQSQLVFQGKDQHSAAIDAVAFLNEEKFLTGSQDGSHVCGVL
jgi:hypothetical protein